MCIRDRSSSGWSPTSASAWPDGLRAPAAPRRLRPCSPTPHHPQRRPERIPVDLFEHQAKELFARHGVPVPTGKVATTPEQARAAAEELGGRVVVKAQVKTGGRLSLIHIS